MTAPEVDPGDIVRAALAGAFPMDDEPLGELRYYMADPRAILPLDGLRVPRSVARALRGDPFELRVDTAFAEVIAACAEGRDDGVWLTPRLAAAYTALHRRGVAHSLEVWREGRLAAGLFGLRLGAFATAESMFHRVPNAGNALIVLAARHLRADGVRLLDIQMTTPHIERFGAARVDHADYMRRLAGVTSGDR